MVGCSDGTNAVVIANSFEEPGHVRYRNHWDVVRATAGNPDNGFRHRRRLVPRDHNCLYSSTFGRSKASPKIMGILDSVEYQKKRLYFSRIGKKFTQRLFRKSRDFLNFCRVRIRACFTRSVSSGLGSTVPGHRKHFAQKRSTRKDRQAGFSLPFRSPQLSSDRKKESHHHHQRANHLPCCERLPKNNDIPDRRHLRLDEQCNQCQACGNATEPAGNQSLTTSMHQNPNSQPTSPHIPPTRCLDSQKLRRSELKRRIKPSHDHSKQVENENRSLTVVR